MDKGRERGRLTRPQVPRVIPNSVKNENESFLVFITKYLVVNKLSIQIVLVDGAYLT